MSFTKEKVSNLNSTRLSDKRLQPELVEKVKKLIDIANLAGYTLLVTQAFRSIEEQNKLYAQGRTAKGKIVTNAKGGQSLHNFGKAIDFCFIVDGEVSWTDSLYLKIGVWAKKVGLKWGGDWKSIKDMPHVEI